MDGLKVALILSSDDDIRKRFSKLFYQAGISFVLEREESAIILRMLELNVRAVILDMVLTNANGIRFISLIKKLRPRVPVIAVVESDDEVEQSRLLESGVMVCISKQLKDDEVRQQFFHVWG